MNTVINDFIVAFLHPFKTHEALCRNRALAKEKIEKRKKEIGKSKKEGRTYCF